MNFREYCVAFESSEKKLNFLNALRSINKFVSWSSWTRMRRAYYYNNNFKKRLDVGQMLEHWKIKYILFLLI